MAQAPETASTDWLHLELIRIGEVRIGVDDLLLFLLVVAATWGVSRLFRRSVDRIGRSAGAANRPAYYAIGRIGHYLIVLIGIAMALQIAGVKLSSLAVAAGAIGIGIGLGLQQTVNNFFSGIILLFERSLKVGDFVELDNGLQGRVREINVRTTLINTNDNLDVVVPNSILTNNMLTNWTLNENIRRIRVPFGVAYGTDKDKVRKAVLEGARKVAERVGIAGVREPEVWLVGFGDSSLNFELLAWVGRDQVNAPGRTRAAYLWEIESSLREHGIEIPFPQRDLHLRSGFETVQLPAKPEARS